MFRKRFFKKTFKKIYPLLDRYIISEDDRSIILNNEDFNRKYNDNIYLIEAFLHELSKNYDLDFIRKVIMNEILNLNDGLLISLIVTYLNSELQDQKDINYFKKFNEDNSVNIISDDEKRRRDLIDEEYISLRTGGEMFNEIPLNDKYYSLDYDSRTYINDMLRNGSFKCLTRVLPRYKGNFISLIMLLNKYGINYQIINDNLVDNLEDGEVTKLIYNLLDARNVLCTEKIKVLINDKRYNLLSVMVDQGLVGEAVFINDEGIKMNDDGEIIKKLFRSRQKKYINIDN